MINYLDALREEKPNKQRIVALGFMCNEGISAIGEILYSDEVDDHVISNLGSTIVILTSVIADVLGELEKMK